jgi:GlpG protein
LGKAGMRQIATLPEREARTLADYLLTLKIETQLLPEGSSLGVWVCDEDTIPRARAELAEFVKDPAAQRYAGAGRAARELRERQEREDEAYNDRQADLARRMAAPEAVNRPVVTLGLVLACLGVSLASGTAFITGNDAQGLNLHNPVLQAVLIKSPTGLERERPGLDEVLHGQIWRLVTPIFVHFGPLHLLFNLLLLRDLGSAIEARRGSLRLVVLVLVLAVPSNLGQYFFPEVDSPTGPNPLFGGMSGVLYGLFGYAWMKSRFAPELGLFVHPNTVVFLIAWFFLCMTPAVGLGHVANVAHGIGLVLGIAIGAVPHLLGGPRQE